MVGIFKNFLVLCLIFTACVSEEIEPALSSNQGHDFEGDWVNKNQELILSFQNGKATFFLDDETYFGDFQENKSQKYLNYRYFNFEISDQKHTIEWYQSGNLNVIYSATLAGGIRENIQRK